MGYPNQQNKIWPINSQEPGVLVAEPLLAFGDLMYNTFTGRYMQCDDPTFPATWSVVGPPPPATNFQLTGATNEPETVLDVERVIGGFVLDGSAYSVITYRIIARYDPSVAGALRVRLYDMGPIAGPAIVPVLRSTLSIAAPASGDVERVEVALTASGAPGVNTDTIFNTARIYELRVILDGSDPGDEGLIHWAGIEVS